MAWDRFLNFFFCSIDLLGMSSKTNIIPDTEELTLKNPDNSYTCLCRKFAEGLFHENMFYVSIGFQKLSSFHGPKEE